MKITTEIAIKELLEIEKLASELRLAADGWDKDWKTLIATLMSARTTDKKTIVVAENFFKKYDTIEKLSTVSLSEIENMIRSVNFYRNKSKSIYNLSKILVNDYSGQVPHDFEKLVELPGIGRKTANVFLAEVGQRRIGVDVHVNWLSKKMGWTKSDKQHEVEKDLENLFPEKYWGRINWILVRFGQTYKSRTVKEEILGNIKNKYR